MSWSDMLPTTVLPVIPTVLVGTVLVLSAIAFATVGRKDKSAKKRNELASVVPVVPNRHWLFGHMFYPKHADQLTKQYHSCVKHADPQTGFTLFYLLRKPILGINNVEYAQKILRANTYKAAIPIFHRLGERMFGKNNITQINGREWKIHRAPIARALTSETALIAAQRHILNVGLELVSSLSNHSTTTTTSNLTATKETDNEEEESIDIGPVMKMATIDIFAAAALGRDLGSCRSLKPSPVAEAFDFLMEDLFRRFKHLLNPSSLLFWIPTENNKRHKRESEIVKGFLRETVRAHMKQESSTSKENNGHCHVGARNGNNADADWSMKNNLLSQMIAISRSSGSDGDKNEELNVDDLVESMLVLLFAGYDTTANGLSFAFHEISTHPTVEEKCVKEAKKALGEMEELAKGSGLEDCRYDVLKHFPYCHAALLEALRLYPPAAGTLRTIEKDTILGGITIPAGTMVQIPIYHIQRDETNFPRATECIPERWVRQTSDGTWVQRETGDEEEGGVKGLDLPTAGNREAFLTFSSGARNCAGRRFSLQEGTLLLAVLLRDLKFKVKPGYEFKPVNKGPIMQPKDDLPMIISKRE